MLLTIRAIFASFMLMFSFNASADFFSGNNCAPWVYDCNEWPQWTPMYWMEEFSNEMDDDDDYYYGYNNGYRPQYPQGYVPQGYAPQMPYLPQAQYPMAHRPNQNVAPFNRTAPNTAVR